MTIDKSIQIRNIYYMLAYAFQQLKQNNYEDVAGEKFDEIHDLFAEILIRGISYQLKQGLHKEYIGVHESLATLRGKLDINGTIRNKMLRKHVLDCDYDVLSENNLFNQILKTTVLFLVDKENVKHSKKVALKKLMLFFSEVDVIDISTIKWNMLRFDRNSKTYQMLLYICYFILNGMLLTTENGKYNLKSFSDEHMCKLYEKFVLEFYRKHYPMLNAQAAQVEWNVNKSAPSSSMLPIMQTDIMLQFGERTLIIDTKYYTHSLQTLFDKVSIHSHNMYQIFAYVMNYDIKHTGKVDGMLLYAKTDEEITPDGQQEFADGNTVYFRTLDLNQRFEDIKKQLDDIAKILCNR